MKQLTYYQQIDIAESIARVIGVNLDGQEDDEMLGRIIDLVDWGEVEALRKELEATK